MNLLYVIFKKMLRKIRDSTVECKNVGECKNVVKIL